MAKEGASPSAGEMVIIVVAAAAIAAVVAELLQHAIFGSSSPAVGGAIGGAVGALGGALLQRRRGGRTPAA